MESGTMNLARSSLKLFSGKIGASAVQFLGIVYFARVLGASPLGVFFLFQALLGILSIPADFGLRGAVNKRISESDDREAYLSSAILLKGSAVLLVGAVVVLTGSYVDRYVGAPIAVHLAIALALQEFARLALAVLRGELRVGETAELGLARQVVWVIVGGVLAAQGYGAMALIYGLLTAIAVVLLWGWYKTSVSPGRPTVGHARSLVEYGKYILVSSVGKHVYSWMDVAIIGLFLSQTHVGAYEAAWRVTSVILLLSNAIATTIFPQVSQWEAEDAIEKVESVVQRAITPPLYLAVPAFVGTLLFSRDILRLIFGPEFTIASLVLIVLAGEKILQSCHLIFGRSLQAINRPDLVAVAGAATILTNLVLNVVLVLEFGLVGAAVATALSFLLNTVLNTYYLSQFISIELPRTEIFGIVASAAGMGLVLAALKRSIEVDSVPVLLAAVVAGVAVYSGFTLASPPLRSTILQNIKNIV